MAFIEKESEILISNVEIFFSSHFGTGKILEGSANTQEMIINILMFLRENTFYSNLEKIHNFFIGETILI